MKRIVPLLVIVGGVGLVLWAVVRNSGPRQPAPQQAAAPAPTPSASVPSPEATTAPQAAEGEQIVYQFDDEAKMREFAGVWQQRQKALLRMAVLRAYWENEQAGSTTLNTQLQTQYNLSPTGNYVLNAEQRVLMERPAPAAGADAAPVEGQLTETAPVAEEGTVVHTFADEQELQAFGNLWQQRQGSGVRLAVLQSFWDEENGELAKLNSTLAETYTLDVTKNYTLDAQRRVIIERPAAATPPAADVLPAAPSPPTDQPPPQTP